MNRRLAILFGVIVAAGAAVTVGVVQSQRVRAGTPKQTRVFDRRCRGGCSDTALLRVLQNGPSAGQIASGSLTTSTGGAVTTVRASNKTCRTGNAFDSAQGAVSGDGLGTTGSLPDPFGGLGAAPYTDTGGVGFHGFLARPIAPSVNTAAAYTASVFLKPGVSSCAGFADGNNGWGCQWNLSTGALLVATGSGVSCSLVPASNGFYRGIATFSSGSGAADNVYVLDNQPCATSALPSYAGTGTITAYGLKAEQGLTATAYVPGNNQLLTTLSSNQPCVEAQGLLVEGASTNLVLQSQAFDNAAWTPTGSVATSPTRTVDVAIAPDGTPTADSLSFPAVSSGYSVIYQGAFNALGVPYSFSVFLRGAAATTVYVSITNGGSWYTTPAILSASGWARFTATSPVIGGATYVQIGVDFRDGSQSAQGAQTVYAWGAQLEAQPFATSYIPTVGTASARAADVVSVPNPVTGNSYCASALFTPESGAAWNAGLLPRRILGFGALSSSNSSRFEFGTDGNVGFYTFDGTGTIRGITASQGFSSGSSHRLLQCNASGVLSVSFDGAPQSTSNVGAGTGVVSAPGTLLLNDTSASGPWGYLSDVCVGPPGACR